MNTLKFRELKEITKVISSNKVDDDVVFDYFRIVKYKEDYF